MSVIVWPQDGATDVDFNIKPTHTFSVELNDEMPEISIVRKGDGTTINHNLIKVSSTLYRIEFPQPLAEEETYERYLHKAIGKNGEVLPEPLPQITSFTTKDVVVIPPLVLSAVNPLHNEEIPDTITTLMYSADYALDPATVDPSFTLTNTTSGMQVFAAVNVSGKNISVNVDGLLEHSSGYTAAFNPDIIRGVNGEMPSTTYSFSFTTEVVVPPTVFTTPGGFLQNAGGFYDGKYYISGYGSDDEGFIACFNWDGDSVWFNDFRINGQYTRITHIAVNSTGLYSLAIVNLISPVAWEVWLYHQSLSGEYLDKWQISPLGTAYSITSSSTDVYLAYSDGFNYYIQQYNESGFRAEIIFPADHGTGGVMYHEGYIYVGGGVVPDGGLFLTKWYSDLSDSLWYKEVLHPDVIGTFFGYLTFVSDRLWIMGMETTISSILFIAQQYNENGNLLNDFSFPSYSGNLRNMCSDDTYAYIIGNSGLHKIDMAGNMTKLNGIIGYDVLRADDSIGSSHKIAITDRTNVLKLYNR